jgi:hypothetical protein
MVCGARRFVDRLPRPWHQQGGLRTLIAYDLMILRRSAATAFARKRDILLLLVAVPIGLLLVVEQAGDIAESVAGLPVALTMVASAAIAFAVNLAVTTRLAHLREESIVARQALRPAEALPHALFWNLPPLTGGLALTLISGRAVLVPIFLLSYLAGIGVAAGQRAFRRAVIFWIAGRRAAGSSRRGVPRADSRRQRVIELLVGRTGFFGPAITANLVGLAAIGAIAALVHRWLSPHLGAPAAAIITGLPVLLLLLLVLGRTQPTLLRYLLYLGCEPALPALVASILAASLIGGLAIMALAMAAAPPLELLAGAAVLLFLFLALALLRTLHFATKPRQTAEIAVQLDVLAGALTGLVALPLAPVLVVARLWLLARRARAMRYLAP